MNVLVIGGTGNISTAIVDRLNELNYDVTVFNRGQRKIRYKKPVKVITGDKADREGFYSALKGLSFDAVIDMISYFPEDALATLKAFPDKDTHFVFTSTVAAYKRPYRGVPIKETFELWDDPGYFPYGYHKARMEDALNASGRKVTMIRPSLTYGIGCRNIGVLRGNYILAKRIKENKPLIMFGDGTNPWAWTFAPDLAKAFAGVLCRDICVGETYHATSGDVRVWDELYYAFGRVIGKEPKILHMSTEMLMQAAPEQISHVYQEKMFSGVFDNSKIKAHVPEFVCEYDLDRIAKTIYEWWESDPEAGVIDESLDRLEDSLVNKYYECADILKKD